MAPPKIELFTFICRAYYSHTMAERMIRVLSSPDAVALAAAEAVCDAAIEAIGRHRRFDIALSGGSTPLLLYRRLAGEAYRHRIEWARVHVFFTDERCVPPGDGRSNFGMACRELLDHVPVPYEQIHRMRGEIDPEQAAKEYGEMLKVHFGDHGPDLTLLGMGADGHTASLFPYSPALGERHHRCVAVHPAGADIRRITLTAPFLNRSLRAVVLVTGAEKAARVQEVMEGPHDPHRLPVQLIQPTNGKLTWLFDTAAVGM